MRPLQNPINPLRADRVPSSGRRYRHVLGVATKCRPNLGNYARFGTPLFEGSLPMPDERFTSAEEHQAAKRWERAQKEGKGENESELQGAECRQEGQERQSWETETANRGLAEAEARQKTAPPAGLTEEFDLPGGFQGIWLSKKTLFLGAAALAVLVSLGLAWATKLSTGGVGLVGIRKQEGSETGQLEKNRTVSAPALEPVAPLPVPGFGPQEFDQWMNGSLARARDCLNRGRDWLHKKEFDKAIQEFDEAIRLNSKDGDMYQWRGRAWYLKNDYDKAIVDVDEAIRRNAKDSEAYLLRGDVRVNQHEYDRAILDYNEAILLNPSDARYYCSRGFAWSFKQDYEMAIRDYGQAIRLDPDAVYYKERGNVWCAKKEYDEAIEDFSEAIRLNPQDATSYYFRAGAWFAKRKFGEGINDCSLAIRFNSKNAADHIRRASLYYRARGDGWLYEENYERAIEDYDEALRLDSSNELALQNRRLARSLKNGK
jgi:tetratricopeptide (TPR) repeat protein